MRFAGTNDLLLLFWGGLCCHQLRIDVIEDLFVGSLSGFLWQLTPEFRWVFWSEYWTWVFELKAAVPGWWTVHSCVLQGCLHCAMQRGAAALKVAATELGLWLGLRDPSQGCVEWNKVYQFRQGAVRYACTSFDLWGSKFNCCSIVVRGEPNPSGASLKALGYILNCRGSWNLYRCMHIYAYTHTHYSCTHLIRFGAFSYYCSKSC